MPRSQKVFRSRKPSLNRRGCCRARQSSSPPPIATRLRSQSPYSSAPPSSSSSDSEADSIDLGSSACKVRQNLTKYGAYQGGNTFDLVDFEVLNSVLRNMAVCKDCHSSLSMSVLRREGLAATVEIVCTSCQGKATYSNSQKIRVDGEPGRAHDINLRMTHAFRSIGKGCSAMKIFCAIMDMPSACRRYEKFSRILGIVAQKVCADSMKQAAQEAVSLNGQSRDITVALDGSWHKRGYTSLNGLVTATSFDSGKVLDVSILSKYCRCPDRTSNVHVENCYANFHGTSGAM